MPSDAPLSFTWIVVLGAIMAFFAAFGIGANDVANAYATSVGSKALTVKQACALAVVFEFAGATFLGGSVVKTIRKGIADQDAFKDDPALLMWGCLCVITCVGIWLLIMSKFEIPVSTTHSVSTLRHPDALYACHCARVLPSSARFVLTTPPSASLIAIAFPPSPHSFVAAALSASAA
jgi:hypothetical protein